MAKNIRLLAFDYGHKRIGTATGNSLLGTTQALETIPAQQGIPNWQILEKLINEWRPKQLIVGLPLQMDASEGTMAKEANAFADTLHKKFNLPVAMVDERLSSNEADHILRESANLNPNNQQRNTRGLKNKRQKTRDSIAAELILRTWLNDNQTPT